GYPVALEERLILLDVVPQARAESFAIEPPGTWLLAHVAWSDAEHQIRAEPASAAIARHLAMPAGDACLVMERRTWQAARLVTDVVLHFPHNRYALRGRFAPHG
ncbi:MAG: UTRA domain-containing protein, partial [Alphaproteobacteria bacterium]|nr:UTRA domain-containing protein [Alphaproteobacteria bacterium]